MSWQMLIIRHKTGSKLDQQQMRGKPRKCMYNSGRSVDDDMMTKQISLLFLLTGYEKCFWKKERQIKMSSLLNVSNGSKSEEFNLKDIGVRIDNKEQNWFKRAHIGRYLGIARIITTATKLAEENITYRAFLQAEGGIRRMDPLGKKLRIMIFSSP